MEHSSVLRLQRIWVEGFVGWCNAEHLHNTVRFVTSEIHQTGHDKSSLINSRQTYAAARRRARFLH